MDEKVRENRLRRMADRRGLRLERSRARDPQALTFGGYQLINLQTGGCDFGWGNAGRGFAASLDDIEKFLTPAAAPRKGKVKR
jgi:hypothetical protein